MQFVNDILLSLGMNNVECAIFGICYQYGSLPVSTIARYMKQPRTTIHYTVEKMVKKGRLHIEKKQNHQSYTAITPDEMIGILKGQQTNNEKMIGKLEEMKKILLVQDRQRTYMPKVKYYEGKDAVEKIYSIVFNSSERQGYFCVESLMHIYGQNFSDFVKPFIKNKAHIREIVLDTDIGRQYKKLIGSKKNHQVKTIALTKIKDDLLVDSILCDGTWYQMIYDEQLITIEIFHPIIYQTQLALFDFIWQKL